MNNKTSETKMLPLFKILPAINFNFAVIFLLIVSVTSATGSTAFFDNNADLYGALASNLRLMLIVYCFCSYSQNYRLLIPVGMFWLMLMGSIEFYGMVNQIAIDEDYRWFFLYLGISNLAYGAMFIASSKAAYQDAK
ncbi:MAG: hypothetical protein NTX38_02755 [Methylobacter sp.]|nr:hypothetical protein [Methylobacter sp.]